MTWDAVGQSAYLHCKTLDCGGQETRMKDLSSVLYVEDETFGIGILCTQPLIRSESGKHSLLIHAEGLVCRMLDRSHAIPPDVSSKWGWLYRKWTKLTDTFDQCTELFVRRKRSGIEEISLVASRDEAGGRAVEVREVRRYD